MNKTRALRAGFTLVELAVVVVVIGVIAAFAVPRFMSSVERSRAAEAFAYSSTVHRAQERHHARNGTYAAQLASLDAKMVSPEYFTVGEISVPRGHDDFKTGWQLTLTRVGASAGYGAYTVVFNHDGFDPMTSTISSEITTLETSE